VGWLWYLGALVPVIGLVQVGGQAMADRYTYLPLTGIFVASAWSVGGSGTSRSRIRTASFALLAASTLPLAALTRAQVVRWHDTATLFEHALRVTTGNWVAHTAYAKELVAQGAPAAAVGHYLEALRFRPGNPDIHNNLANALADLGRFREAEDHLREALRLDPRHAAALANSGNLAAMRGEFAVAADWYRRSLQIDPDRGGTHHNLGLALLAAGDPQAALPELQEAVRIDPSDLIALTAIGDALALLGRRNEAAEAYRGALAANPLFGPAREGLQRIGR
jgi:tetratricopeptide (TPR) repeat protein